MQVVVDVPIPETTIANLSNSHEDTLLLLDLVRQKRKNEGQKKREEMIREMAMQQKLKQKPSSSEITQLSWNSKTAASTRSGI